jgi:hypothetical protein
MVSKILFWSGFGTRAQNTPSNTSLSFPIYGLVGASFGYWLQGMEDNQMRYLGETRDRLIEKRRRRAEREGGFNNGSTQQKLGEGLFASPKVVVDTDGTREITSAAQ